MNERRFVEFLNAVRADERAFYHYESSKPFKDVIDILYNDVGQFRYYTYDGRFQDLVIRLIKDIKYDTLGYEIFLKDLEDELKKFVVPNIIMLPLNFLDNNIIKNDLVLNNNIRLFLPTEKDLEKHTSGELLLRQEERKKKQFDEPICNYFDSVLDGHLDKEHILLAKDRDFFRYPILTIYVEDIDVGVEDESKFITEAIYSILRMIDYKSGDTEYGRGPWQKVKYSTANTYIVYYNINDGYPSDHAQYGGYSFKFNFSEFLDISTYCFLNCKEWFCNVTDIFIKARFIDKRKLPAEDLDTVKKWCNSIILYNTAYELAAIEKYDACALILCALMESIFIKNKGRNKSEILTAEIKEFLCDIYSKDGTEDLVTVIKSIYKYRNKIIHEGVGLEEQFIRARSIYQSQGTYRGMKPFHYGSSFYPDKDLLGIDTILKCLVDILIGNKMIEKISSIIEKAN